MNRPGGRTNSRARSSSAQGKRCEISDKVRSPYFEEAGRIVGPGRNDRTGTRGLAMARSTTLNAFRRTLSALLAVFFAFGCCAPLAASDFDQATYRGRRERLAGLAKEGIVIVQSVARDQPGLSEFLIDDSDNHDFLYLTGLESPGGTLLLLPQSTEYPEILFVPQPEIGWAQKETGIKAVLAEEDLDRILGDALTDFSLKRYTERMAKTVSTEIARVLSLAPRKIFYLNYPRYMNLDTEPPARLRLAARLKYFSAAVEVRDDSPLLNQLRVRHDAAEIALIRHVVQIGSQGIIASMKACGPGAYDYQVAAAAEFAFKDEGAERLGYPSLVYISPFGRAIQPLSAAELAGSSEPMSAVHQMQSGDLVMIDAGAEYHHYTSDLSRTVPVSGRFSEEQKQLYEAVLAAHHAAVAVIRPGTTFGQVQEAAVDVLRAKGLERYFTFGTSHFIGMDVHDVGNYEVPLEPGMILTVEPGIVESKKNITIHVEDMVLVTEQGHEVLSKSIPIEVGDIEKLMAGR